MTSLPKTYRAAVLEKANAPFVVKEVELKQPGRREVLVRVLACGVCGSDAGVQSGHMPNPWPIVPGHELVGDVVAVGDEVTRFKGGERVGGPWHGGHDQTCKACQRALYQCCDNAVVNGVSRDGGYAEYVVLREEAVVRLPSDADPAEMAPLLCAGVTVFNGIRHMAIPQGGLVAVQGLGGLGHLAVQYARAMGYDVVALSSGDSKRDFAAQLGASSFVDTSKQDAVQALRDMGGASLVVATAPSPDAISPLVEALHAGGKLLVLGISSNPVPFNTVAMITKGTSVHGWPSGHALDAEEAVAFASRFGIKCLIEKYPLADVQKAYDAMMSGNVRFRAVLTM